MRSSSMVDEPSAFSTSDCESCGAFETPARIAPRTRLVGVLATWTCLVAASPGVVCVFDASTGQLRQSVLRLEHAYLAALEAAAA